MKKVLIADDKATSRELVRTVLEKSGYEVVEASDGVEALRNAREIQARSDHSRSAHARPGRLRRDQELRRDPEFAATPVMALTASAMQGDRERALAAGFTGYITKPIQPAACCGAKWNGCYV